jgi:hypothetical protein
MLPPVAVGAIIEQSDVPQAPRLVRSTLLPAVSAVDALEQAVTVGRGQERVTGRMQRRDAMALQREGFERSVAEP